MDNLLSVTQHYFAKSAPLAHNDKLFLSQLLTGFFALLCLGELVYPDDIQLCNPHKMSKRLSVDIFEDFFQFHLPTHKANKFYKGNLIVLQKLHSPIDPYQHFFSYLQSCDRLFPFSSPL